MLLSCRELREKIQPEIMELIKQQRLNRLCEGTCFRKISSRRRQGEAFRTPTCILIYTFPSTRIRLLVSFLLIFVTDASVPFLCENQARHISSAGLFEPLDCCKSALMITCTNSFALSQPLKSRPTVAHGVF